MSGSTFKPLQVVDWLNSPVSNSLRFLWLGKANNGYMTVILLSNALDNQKVKNAISQYQFASYINVADDVSNVFKKYREIMTILLTIIFILLFLLLVLRYSFKKALIYFLPPLSACSIALASLGWLGIPLTLFSLLAVILVLGIAVDYVVFFAENRSTYQSTMLAVLLSATTTILSFGLLGLSATPVVGNFGLTVFIGIISAFLLSPLVVSTRNNE